VREQRQHATTRRAARHSNRFWGSPGLSRTDYVAMTEARGEAIAAGWR